ncbi:MAG: outer membrane beta-barrel protein [Bacteroidetes bacterium]|nr:outer membrane beta-barrel protein [Bacteroidota bacterium]
MRSILPVLLVCLIPAVIEAQNDYYVTDSTLTAGVRLVDGGAVQNARICEMRKGNEIVDFTPNQIKEYGFKEGKVYVSKEIRINGFPQRVFLERLVTGNLTLYFYKEKGNRMFYLEKDNTSLIELPKHTPDNKKPVFRIELNKIVADCQNVTDAVKLVSYTRGSMKKLVNTYNGCKWKPFPFFKYGILLGYGFTRLEPSTEPVNTYLSEFNYKEEGSFLFGFFLDVPIRRSSLSLHTDLTFTRNSYSYTAVTQNKTIDFVANTSSLTLPLLLRYSSPFRRVRPFVNLGGIGVYLTGNENKIYEATYEANNIYCGLDEKPLIPKTQAGYSAGGGFEVKLNYRNNIFLEVRYNKLYSLTFNNDLHVSEIQCITSINF